MDLDSDLDLKYMRLKLGNVGFEIWESDLNLDLKARELALDW